MFAVLREGAIPGPYPSIEAATEAGAVTLNYGRFFNALLNFLIVAFAMFMVVKAMNRLRRQAPAAPPPGPTPDQQLLTEIRDALKRA
jgi:large conductance mechanosensitive channel